MIDLCERASTLPYEGIELKMDICHRPSVWGLMEGKEFDHKLYPLRNHLFFLPNCVKESSVPISERRTAFKTEFLSRRLKGCGTCLWLDGEIFCKHLFSNMEKIIYRSCAYSYVFGGFALCTNNVQGV